MSYWPVVIPEEFWVKEKKEEVVLLLALLPIDAMTKKHLFILWAQAVGAAITDEDLVRILRGHPRETWG